MGWIRGVLLVLVWLSLTGRAGAEMPVQSIIALPGDLLQQSGTPMMLIDPQSGRILAANPAAIHFYGYSGEQLARMSIDQINSLDPAEVAAERQRALKEKRNYFVFPHRLANGEIRTMQVNSWPVQLNNGGKALFSVLIDVTGQPLARDQLLSYTGKLESMVEARNSELLQTQVRYTRMLMAALAVTLVVVLWLLVNVRRRRHAEKELTRQTILLSGLLDSIPDLVFFKDPQGVYLGCNLAFTHFVGRDRDRIVGRTDADLFGAELAAMFRSYDERMMRTGIPRSNEEEVRYPDGRQVLLDTLKAPLHDASGKLVGLLGISRDITARKQAEARIENLAFYDSLTQLPNRIQLNQRLPEVIQQLGVSGQHGVLLFIDLDYFKTINDVFGHATGDELLQIMAGRLRRHARERDILARLGGDEFVLVMTQLSNDEAIASADADQRIAELQRHMAMPVSLHAREVKLGCSVGAVLFGDTWEVHADLLKCADMAMYQAKDAGRGTCSWYEPALRERIEYRFTVGEELRHALRKDEFVLYLQPQVDGNGQICSFETLVRWQHPQRGLVLPGEFIPVAEENGLIAELGDWVLNHTCHLMAQHPRLHCSVNVSVRQFLHPEFLDRIDSLLRDHEIGASRLTLEVTESLLIADVEQVALKMQSLQQLGVRLSIDDFGTGYSSLAYLKRLPIDELKIDRDFVRDLPGDTSDASLVVLILAMARHLNLSVVAEGVENAEQAEFLRQHGCHYYQGYFYGRPQPIDSWLEVLDHARGVRPAAI